MNTKQEEIGGDYYECYSEKLVSYFRAQLIPLLLLGVHREISSAGAACFNDAGQKISLLIWSGK